MIVRRVLLDRWKVHWNLTLRKTGSVRNCCQRRQMLFLLAENSLNKEERPVTMVGLDHGFCFELQQWSALVKLRSLTQLKSSLLFFFGVLANFYPKMVHFCCFEASFFVFVRQAVGISNFFAFVFDSKFKLLWIMSNLVEFITDVIFVISAIGASEQLYLSFKSAWGQLACHEHTVDYDFFHYAGGWSWFTLWKNISHKYLRFIGWIQTLFRERVKSQSLGNQTLNSESASKIMPACGFWVLECM